MGEPDFSPVYGPSDDDNDMLRLALGALSTLDILAEALQEDAPEHVAETIEGALLDAALGLLSLRRTVHRWANHAAGDHAPPSAPSRRAAPPTHILR